MWPPLIPFPKRRGYILAGNKVYGGNEVEDDKNMVDEGDQYHNDRTVLGYRNKIEIVRAKVLLNNCVSNIVPLLSHPSVKTRALACESISNLALYTPGRSALMAQWIHKTNDGKIRAYELERKNLQLSITKCDASIETIQLKMVSKSDNKKEIAHDMEMLKEYHRVMSILQKRSMQLKDNENFEKMMSRKRLLDTLFHMSKFDKSSDVQTWATKAILNMY